MAVVYNRDGTNTITLNTNLSYTHFTSRFKIIYFTWNDVNYSDINVELLENITTLIEEKRIIEKRLNTAHREFVDFRLAARKKFRKYVGVMGVVLGILLLTFLI
jgi:hypothetical protein